MGNIWKKIIISIREQAKQGGSLMKISKNLTSHIPSHCLLMVQDAFWSSNHNITPLQKDERVEYLVNITKNCSVKYLSNENTYINKNYSIKYLSNQNK